MSGGGYLVAHDDGLYARAAAALVRLGAVEAPDSLGGCLVQVRDAEGRLFTMYERVAPGAEWEVFGAPLAPAPGLGLPGSDGMTACPFDCRWPELTVHLAAVIAQTSQEPTWLIDGDGVMWKAEAVDPARLAL